MSKNQVLLEKWAELIDVERNAKSVPDHLRESMATLLENQEKYIHEGTVAGDIAQFTPILIPAVRRIFPNLLAHELVGVQPLNAPTGYAYALRYHYGGTGVQYDGTLGTNVRGNTTTDRGTASQANNYVGANANSYGSVAIISATNWSTAWAVGNNVFIDGGTTNKNIGTVVHVEPRALLVKLTTPGDIGVLGAGIKIDNTTAEVADTVAFYVNNEAGYNLIFKNYAGKLSTANGEVLGNDMKTMKMALERVAVEAETRKMKAEYTVELAQDLKAVHGLDAETELINILEYEITAEIDRDLVDQINGTATLATPWSYGAPSNYGVPEAGVADGRWEQERFRTIYTKIVREANAIALTSRRGAGNFIIGSINAITALEGLNSFMYSTVPGDVQAGIGVVKVGTLDGRFAVYIDTFAAVDYITVGYKGASQFDTGVIYCPYVPLMMQKVVDPITFQPKVGFMQRSAIVNNLYGAENYYRTFLCDFTASQLEGPVGGIYGGAHNAF